MLRDLIVGLRALVALAWVLEHTDEVAAAINAATAKVDVEIDERLAARSRSGRYDA